MKLYGNRFSNASRRVHMLCEECQLPYTYISIDLLRGEQQEPQFLTINPNGKVPVIDDDGFVVWESHAIMRYLCEKHGLDAWYPSSLKDRTRVDQWLDWNHTRLGPEAGKIAFNALILRDKGDPSRIEEGKRWLEKILPVMDAVLAARPFLCGERHTIADIAAVSNIAYLELCGYELARFPAVVRWYEGFRSRPSFVRTAVPAVA